MHVETRSSQLDRSNIHIYIYLFIFRTSIRSKGRARRYFRDNPRARIDGLKAAIIGRRAGADPLFMVHLADKQRIEANTMGGCGRGGGIDRL